HSSRIRKLRPVTRRRALALGAKPSSRAFSSTRCRVRALTSGRLFSARETVPVLRLRRLENSTMFIQNDGVFHCGDRPETYLPSAGRNDRSGEGRSLLPSNAILPFLSRMWHTARQIERL